MNEKKIQKIQDYLNAIMIISERSSTFESSAIHTLAIDASNLVSKLQEDEK